MIHVEGKPRA